MGGRSVIAPLHIRGARPREAEAVATSTYPGVSWKNLVSAGQAGGPGASVMHSNRSCLFAGIVLLNFLAGTVLPNNLWDVIEQAMYGLRMHV